MKVKMAPKLNESKLDATERKFLAHFLQMMGSFECRTSAGTKLSRWVYEMDCRHDFLKFSNQGNREVSMGAVSELERRSLIDFLKDFITLFQVGNASHNVDDCNIQKRYLSGTFQMTILGRFRAHLYADVGSVLYQSWLIQLLLCFQKVPW